MNGTTEKMKETPKTKMKGKKRRQLRRATKMKGKSETTKKVETQLKAKKRVKLLPTKETSETIEQMDHKRVQSRTKINKGVKPAK